MFKLSKRSAIIFKMTVCLSQRNTCLSTENSSRHEIKGKNRIFRVASLATKFLRRFPYYKFSKNRYIRFSHRPSTQTIYSLISRSLESGEGCIIKDWNMGLPYAFLSFSMISRVFLKQEWVPLLILIAPVSGTQLCYPELLNLPASRNQS